MAAAANYYLSANYYIFFLKERVFFLVVALTRVVLLKQDMCVYMWLPRPIWVHLRVNIMLAAPAEPAPFTKPQNNTLHSQRKPN